MPLETLLLNISNQEISRQPCRICRNSQVKGKRGIVFFRPESETQIYEIYRFWRWILRPETGDTSNQRIHWSGRKQFRLNFMNTRSHPEAGGLLALSTKKPLDSRWELFSPSSLQFKICEMKQPCDCWWYWPLSFLWLWDRIWLSTRHVQNCLSGEQ